MTRTLADVLAGALEAYRTDGEGASPREHERMALEARGLVAALEPADREAFSLGLEVKDKGLIERVRALVEVSDVR